jgi:hypothetical protein
MATEKLRPDLVIDFDGEGFNGFVTNIDEDLSTPDGSTMFTSLPTAFSSASMELGLSDSIITDEETVNTVTAKVRTRITGNGISNNVSMYLQLATGTGLGKEYHGISAVQTVPGSYTTLSFTHATWNVDWTAAQLDEMSIDITVLQVSPDTGTVAIDVVQVEVDYTALEPHEVDPPKGSLALDPKLPVTSLIKEPGRGAVSINRKTPGLSWVIGTPVDQRQLQGHVAYINPITETLLPDGGAITSGWQGFISNIDENLATTGGDGSTMYYTRPAFGPLGSNVLTVRFADVSNNISNTSTVLNVFARIRARAQPGSQWTGEYFSAALSVDLVIDGNIKSRQFVVLDALNPSGTVFANFRLGAEDWDADWTITQLSTAELRIQFYSSSAEAVVFPEPFEVPVTAYIDTVNLEVRYIGQTPQVIPVTEADPLTLSPKTPDLYQEHFSQPAREELDFAGKIPTLFREDTIYPDPEFIDLNPATPRSVENHIPLPAVGPRSLTGKVPVINRGVYPGVEELDLTADRQTTRHRSD